MTGNIFFEQSAVPARLHTHAVFHIAAANGGEAWLHFVDPRRFGRIDAVEGGDGELAGHPSFADLGPEPLEATAGELGRYLFETSRGRSAPVKSFLMDQRVVVGVGNIYASESLFRAGIHPGRKAGAIPRPRYELLARYIRETLEKAIAAGGTSFSDYRHPDGETGYFQVELNVYDRAGEPCPVCGAKVRLLRQAGRSTFFCGSCQK
jgi:formamidopyrimidine-DNA glycosylase